MTTLAPVSSATLNPVDLDDPATLARVQEQFLEALPRIREHAEVKFRFIRDPGTRDDAIANTIGIGWKHWLSAIRHGKDPSQFVSSIADKAVRQVRSGRRVDGQERAKDVMSPRAQKNKGFAVEQLNGSTRRSFEEIHGDPNGQERMDAAEERLTDNLVTPIPEQVAFKERYRMMLDDMSEKKRAIVADLAGGEDTQDVAARHGVTPGTQVSQIRREGEGWWADRERKDNAEHDTAASRAR